MKEVLHRFFILHWQRKLVALLSAICIWFLVNRTIEVEDFPEERIANLEEREILDLAPPCP